MQEVFEGTTAVITVNVIDSGAHVAANIDTATTRLSTHASAVPTVTNPSTGVYKIKFSGLSPALSVSDNDDGVSCAVNGDIGGTSWSTYHVPIKVAATMRGTDNASTFDHTTDDVNTNAASRTASQATGFSTFDHTTDQVVASNMRGTDGANTVAPDNASITSILADTNELQLNQGNWLTATGFSTHSAADVATALQAVANSFKADVSALASQASVDTIDSIVDAIKAKTDQLAFTVAGQVDANALTGGGGDDAATIYSHFTSLSRQDAFKADVSGLATQTSVDSIDGDVQNIGSDVSAILTDTNELQLNQGNWVTATGFSTHSSSDVVSGLQAVANDFKADVSSLLTTASYSGSLPANFSTLLIGTGADLGKVTTSNPAAGSGSSHTAADVAALILETPANKLATNASGQVESSNMRGTDGANTVAPVDVSASVAAILADTNELQQNQNNWLTATGFSTHDAAAVVTAMQVVADDFKADVSGLGGGGASAADIYTYFTAGTREDVFKADVSNLSTDAPTAQEIYDLFVSGSNEDVFKADVSALATSAELAQLSSGGTGLNQITVRVQDSNGDALQGAVVNIDNTVLSLVTTPTGEVVFNLDNNTYSFDVSPPAGYDTPASQQLVVSGDSTIIFTLTGSSSGGGGDVAWVG